MSKVPREKKEATLGISVIPIIVIIAALGIGIILFGSDPHIPILIAAAAGTLIAVFVLGYTWGEIEKGIIESIGSVMQAILILAIIGMLIGTWIAGGIVPTLIYYGLQILSPSFFLITALLLCSVVAIATGSSWTTAGTVGVALIGIAQGLGISPALAAGCIVSGAYFGDKMSPLSDTTNLAPAMAGANLFDHIKHMFYTTGLSYGISAVIFIILGLQYRGKVVDASEINGILDAIQSIYIINPLFLLVPVITIGAVAMKMPAIPGLLLGVVLGSLCMLFQGGSLGDMIGAIHYGAEAASGHAMVDELLTNGGMDSMMWTISLIMCALTFGGVLEATGMMQCVARNMMSLAKKTGSLILVTVLSCLFVNILCADQYLAIALPGKMFKDEYARRGLAPRNLSRALEDSGTVTSALVPWNTCGATMMSSLGVSPFAYAPYAFFNLLSPIVSVTYGYLGFSIMTLEEDPASEQYVRPMKVKKSPKELEEYISNYKAKHANA
ncbi:Na+/H+ antiporter NhaC [Sedimentibacter sp.]|uniref:Na+/H+ antiporter NhaC n=1 Tax=Sedimentibacter sp. TaxID=1960295 RepID=UPI0028A12815|nr:Na+/H+ antiporter NhaC [Sedimentibacter sp.]